MWWWWWWWCIVVLLTWIIDPVLSSIYHASGSAQGWIVEEKMFATDEGPFGWKGESFIHIEASVLNVNDDEKDEFQYALAMLGCDAELYSSLDDICNLNFSIHNGEYSTGHLYPLHRHSMNNSIMSLHYVVHSSRQQQGIIQTCKRLDDISPYSVGSLHMNFNATFTFKNPYGYLPGLLYGNLPFHGFLALAYLFMDLIFIYLFYKHRKSILRIQYCILVVLFLTTMETALYYISYEEMNLNGTPACCPYPTLLILAIVFQVLAKGGGRILVLMVSLGYGVVRPTLSKMEIGAILMLGIGYVTSELCLQMDMIERNSKGTSDPPFFWSLLELLTNGSIFLWIYFSLVYIRKSLLESNQTVKFEMYESLVAVIIWFAIVSFVLTLVQGGIANGQIECKWYNRWILWSAERFFNFVIVAAICIIWRPHQTSHLYAYSSQLPQDEIDNEKLPSTSLESTFPQSDIEYEIDSSLVEIELPQKHNQHNQQHNKPDSTKDTSS